MGFVLSWRDGRSSSCIRYMEHINPQKGKFFAIFCLFIFKTRGSHARVSNLARITSSITSAILSCLSVLIARYVFKFGRSCGYINQTDPVSLISLVACHS